MLGRNGKHRREVRSSESFDNLPELPQAEDYTSVEETEANTGSSVNLVLHEEQSTSVDENDDEVVSNVEGDGFKHAWQFNVRVSVGCQKQSLTASDVIGTIAFDRTNQYFATGGFARKIRVYSLDSLISDGEQYRVKEMLPEEEEEEQDEDGKQYYKLRRWRRSFQNLAQLDHESSTVRVICTPAKLSCVKWHLQLNNVIGCGDYDGVVTEWDVETGYTVSERDEHSGHKVWSIDYCCESPNLLASSSDDGTVRVWARGASRAVQEIVSPRRSPVCCAEFSPSSSFLMAVACADSNVYVYDMRTVEAPVFVLRHHRRAVSYVRFLRSQQLVSASIDSTVKVWDISSLSTEAFPAISRSMHDTAFESIGLRGCLRRTFRAHLNVRNFVGLSVWSAGGLLACGSETNEAFAYDVRRYSDKPVLQHDFGGIGPAGSSSLRPVELLNASESVAEQGQLSVSAVCWRQHPSDCTLVAANANGIIHVIEGHSI